MTEQESWCFECGASPARPESGSSILEALRAAYRRDENP